MDKTRLRYFEGEDVLHLAVADGREVRSVELGPNITVELDEHNELVGIEILNASAFLRDAVLDSVQARTLDILQTAPA